MQEPHSTKDLATPRSSLEKRSEATDPQGPSRDAVDSEMAGYRAPAHRSGSTPAQERWARILPEVAHEAEVGRTRWLDYKGPLEKVRRQSSSASAFSLFVDCPSFLEAFHSWRVDE